MSANLRRVASGGLVLALVVASGCSPANPTGRQAKSTGAAPAHDHGDGQGPHTHGGSDPHDVVITEKDVPRPADYRDAVRRIQGYRDSIERDAASPTPGKAHRALDELDFVLQWLPGIARDSGVPKDRWEDVNTTAQDLRGLFEKVHGNIDNHKAPDFDSVKEPVDTAIGRLQKIAPGATGTGTTPAKGAQP